MSKRLPIVLCLDVSGSMNSAVSGGKTRIDLLNTVVNEFVVAIKTEEKARVAAEISFLAFDTAIRIETDFKPVDQLIIPSLSAIERAGTNMGDAVLKSIDKIDKRVTELKDVKIGRYIPFLVLVTDGDPDGNFQDRYLKSVEVMKSRCQSYEGLNNAIIPFIIGVGDDINPEKINRYSEGFVNGYIPVKGDGDQITERMRKAFKFVSDSVTGSISRKREETFSVIKCDYNKLIDEFNNDTGMVAAYDLKNR